MSNKDAMFSVVLKKFGDKLIYANPAKESLYKQFVNALEDGQHVEVFFDANVDDGTLAQIAKIKASIRQLAKETGNTFEEMQDIIKEASGLIVEKEGQKIIKSFANCSKSELNLAIETIIQHGDFLNINFR